VIGTTIAHPGGEVDIETVRPPLVIPQPMVLPYVVLAFVLLHLAVHGVDGTPWWLGLIGALAGVRIVYLSAR
jgi:hypothetical protein